MTLSTLLLVIATSLHGAWLGQSDSRLLWEVGRQDNYNAEFALAPAGYRGFRSDGFFVVGESDPRRDWPYVHPGPRDAWAGAREHTFIVLFGLKATPTAGDCRLDIDLLDSHDQDPPRLRVEVNDRSFERSVPRGAGDASIDGNPGAGKEHRFSIPFPASLLKAGDNEVRITTIDGSWLLYDSLALSGPSGMEPAPPRTHTIVSRVEPVRALLEKDGRMVQPLRLSFRHIGSPESGAVKLEGLEPAAIHLESPEPEIELLIPAVTADATRRLEIEIENRPLAARTVTFKVVPKLTVYVLPHSHTDIGYTEIQTAIEKKQVENLVAGIGHARKTAGYPAGARFVWNVEVLWAADLYLRRLSEPQRAEFLDAVRKGQVVLNGMYLNELTGLCRPEELVRLFRLATVMANRTGTPIKSAMISDVPGYTWGTVTAMAQAGIRYFSVAPNYFDRIGTILREWENKPFYWVGPDGRNQVLVWIPFWGYAMSHRYGRLSAQLVDDFCEGLAKRAYPYDIAHVRWSGHGDNAVPDPAICEFVRDWNSRYAWPKFIISGTDEAFGAFEARYGDRLPKVRGDWTPYWEDGAGSSALETAMNRQSSDRLVQAETLFAMLRPEAYPASDFESAWNHVLLYSEHTWGAWCSVSDPARKETLEQWELKRGYALEADRVSRRLFEQSTDLRRSAGSVPPSTVDVFNTLSWARSGIVLAPPALSAAGNRVTDDRGRPVPSQRLASGELAFFASDLPPFAARRYLIAKGAAHAAAKASADSSGLDSGAVHVTVDTRSGGLSAIGLSGLAGNFVDTAGGNNVNEYLYLIGDDLRDIRRNGPVRIQPVEQGPLVASLLVESDAPGCRSLKREVRVVAGQDYVELYDHVDKARLEAKDYRSREGKESVNFAFPFNVPGGEMFLDIPLGGMKPEADQIPSACKNWFTVGRFADISNADRGVTWVTLDAPLVQVGALTATLLGSQANPDIWRRNVEPTQKLFAWVMNNHWGTNYRAYQDGPTLFRFVVRPHLRRDHGEASRFAAGFSAPLLALPARGPKPSAEPFLRVEPADVVVTALKPSDDGRAIIIRLFGASGQPRSATLKWSAPAPRAVFWSNTGEAREATAQERIEVPAYGLVTLRAEWGTK